MNDAQNKGSEGDEAFSPSMASGVRLEGLVTQGEGLLIITNVGDELLFLLQQLFGRPQKCIQSLVINYFCVSDFLLGWLPNDGKAAIQSPISKSCVLIVTPTVEHYLQVVVQQIIDLLDPVSLRSDFLRQEQRRLGASAKKQAYSRNGCNSKPHQSSQYSQKVSRNPLLIKQDAFCAGFMIYFMLCFFCHWVHILQAFKHFAWLLTSRALEP